jgi:hypothetical protein
MGGKERYCVITNPQQNAIDAIMDSFNFSRVAKCMQALKWGWGEAKEIPDEAQIRKSARQRMRTACEQYNTQKRMVYVSSGGFVASCDHESLRLAFEIEDREEEITVG